MGGVGDEQELLHELDNLGVREHEGEHLQEQRHWIRPRIDEEEAAPSVQRPHFAILVVVRDTSWPATMAMRNSSPSFVRLMPITDERAITATESSLPGRRTTIFRPSALTPHMNA